MQTNTLGVHLKCHILLASTINMPYNKLYTGVIYETLRPQDLRFSLRQG